jgi:hypothetical protein
MGIVSRAPRRVAALALIAGPLIAGTVMTAPAAHAQPQPGENAPRTIEELEVKFKAKLATWNADVQIAYHNYEQQWSPTR